MTVTRKTDGEIEVTTFTDVDLKKLKDDLAQEAFDQASGETVGHCRSCKKPFSDKNVFSQAGWQETKISGMCERCWDDIMKEE